MANAALDGARILVTGGAGFIGSNFARMAIARWPKAPVIVPGSAERRELAGSAGALLVYYVITPYLGYTLSTLLVATGLYRTMGRYRWPVALLIGGVTTAALYLVFRVWLVEPLPTGVTPVTGWFWPSGPAPPGPSSKSAHSTPSEERMPRKKFMSWVPPSLSGAPWVTSGTAVTPPPPVETAVPAPSRRNQHSTVNCARLEESSSGLTVVTW